MNTRSIDSLCLQVASGGTPSRKEPTYFGGEIPWVKTMDLDDGPIVHTDEKITVKGLGNSAAKLFPAGSVMLAMYGATVGKLGYLEVESACNQAACALVADPESSDSRWLYYAMLANRDRLIGLASGAAQQNLNVGLIRNFEIRAPWLGEQRAIGEVLGALDDKIAANRVVMIRAEELAVALASKCDQPVRLGQVAQQRRSSVSPMKFGSETVLHYSLPAFDEGKAALESAEEIKSAKNEIENPAVLVSKLNPRIPRLWPVDTAASSVRRLASTEFVVLESSELGVGELWAAILHGDVFGQLQSIVGGTSNSHQRVRPQDVLDAVVPDTRQLDQADRKLLVSLCRLRGQLVEANDSLARTRDELLPLLMNGRITVKDAEHAVEGVL